MQKRRRRTAALQCAIAAVALTPVAAWPQSALPIGVRSPLVWGVAALLAIATVMAALIIWRRQENAAGYATEAEVPPLLFPASPAARPRPVRPAAAAHSAPAPPVRRAAAGSSAPPPPQFVAVAAPSTGSGSPAAPPPADAGSLVDGKTIRFHRPTDGTLQILPGRLDIIAGADKGQTIRFVRAGAAPEITFGRSEGPPYLHVQLRAPTVSRKHAQMRYQNSSWCIRNLSGTNPVVVNGEDLGAEGTERTLREGDRIEMGEIVFIFRER
jgi:hypothetical protein